MSVQHDIKIKFNVKSNFDRAAKSGFAEAMRPEMAALGFTLQGEVRRRMRKDRGAERENVRFKVLRAGLRVDISGNKIQTFIDTFGRRAGAKMPPYKRGSQLFGWVGRNIPLGDVTRSRRLTFASDIETRRRFVVGRRLRSQRASEIARQESISFLIARAIGRRGIAGKDPFGRAALANERLVRARITQAVNNWLKSF